MKKIIIILIILLILGTGFIVYGSVNFLGSLTNTPFIYILSIIFGIILGSIGLLIAIPIFMHTYRSSKRNFSEELKGIYEPACGRL